MAVVKRVMWDLCSGLGGASQYFDLHPEWEVYRFDNNFEELWRFAPLNTHWRDVREWRTWFQDYPEPCFIWASPPCLDFSNAYGAPKGIAKRAGLDHEPDLEIVNAIKDIIDYFNPPLRAIENVVGAAAIFSPMFGRYQKLGPFMIWGNLPHIVANIPDSHKADVDERHSPIRANIKARIPMMLSKAIFEATNQPTLAEF